MADPFEVAHSDYNKLKEIGTELKAAIIKTGVSQVIDDYAERTGLSTVTVRESFNGIEKGGLYRIAKNTPDFTARHLDRLAILFDIVGIAKDALIVAKVRELNPDFKYPIDQISPALKERLKDLDA